MSRRTMQRAWGPQLILRNRNYSTRFYTPPPPTLPDPPISLSATPGDTQVVLTWTAPFDGGSAITDYIVQYRVTPS